MIVRFANVIYWAAAAACILLLVAAVTGSVDGSGRVGLAILAVLILIAGGAIRYVFAGR